MKLIIEKVAASVYVYREDEKSFKKIEKLRSKLCTKLKITELDKECDLTKYEDDVYFVINL